MRVYSLLLLFQAILPLTHLFFFPCHASISEFSSFSSFLYLLRAGDPSAHFFDMPAHGGAAFGFAIIVAAALVTWGIIALVNVASDSSDSSDDYAESREADSDLQVFFLFCFVSCDGGWFGSSGGGVNERSLTTNNRSKPKLT